MNKLNVRLQKKLNLNDIQGNVVRAYGRYSFPFARYFFFNISPKVYGDAEKKLAARTFIENIRHEVTTAAPWPHQDVEKRGDSWEKPACTMNIAFTFLGLLKLGLPYRTMQGFPFEFSEGMRARAFILGDRDQTITDEEALGWDEKWDDIWKRHRVGEDQHDSVDIWVSVNAQMKEGTTNAVAELETVTEKLLRWADDTGKAVRVLRGHGKNSEILYQEANAVFDVYRDENGNELPIPSPKEHFGFTDGIGDPVFEGQYPDHEMSEKVVGRGKLMAVASGKDPEWQPIAAGEFLLGHPDESQELPPTGMPSDFMRNGTFMAYRKLHQNVAAFRNVVREEAEDYSKIMRIGIPEAMETIYAKMCGRWRDGVPLSVVPTYEKWIAFGIENGLHPEETNSMDTVENLKKQIAYIRSNRASDFRFGDDSLGYKCPVGSHLRRVNTRDYLAPRNEVGVDANGVQY